MDNTKRQYRVYQTLVIEIITDIFDTKMPTAQQVEEEIAFAIMNQTDIDIKNINTRFLHIEDKTR